MRLDVDVASVNIACKGQSRFCHPRGLSAEIMKGNVDFFHPLITRFNGTKLVVER
ncbi:MAG: hypothetical protein ABI337_01500 [Nitrososphaera sp.]|jgi:putative transposase